MIGQPRHITNDKSSFIDLLFTTNRKLLCDVSVKQTNCHCNIVYGSLNLSMPFAPPYYRDVWDYNNTDLVCIQVIKVDYKYPDWMNPKIISFLRNRSKLTKTFFPLNG